MFIFINGRNGYIKKIFLNKINNTILKNNLILIDYVDLIKDYINNFNRETIYLVTNSIEEDFRNVNWKYRNGYTNLYERNLFESQYKLLNDFRKHNKNIIKNLYLENNIEQNINEIHKTIIKVNNDKKYNAIKWLTAC